MSEISRFFGIVIAMYHRDHEPPHFHARYGGRRGPVRISDGYVQGQFPPRVKAMVLEWWDLHREELLENLQRSGELKQIKPIAPLELQMNDEIYDVVEARHVEGYTVWIRFEDGTEEK